MARTRSKLRPTGSFPFALRLLGAIAVVAAAFWAGDRWVDRRQDGEIARRAAAFVERGDAQVRRIEAIYAQPIHDVRPERRQVIGQLRTTMTELDLDRRPERRPAALTTMARLFTAVRQDAAAVPIVDALWRRGERSPALAAGRAVAHARTLLREWTAPRAGDLEVEASRIGDHLEPVLESLEALAAAGGGPPASRMQDLSRAVDHLERGEVDVAVRVLGELAARLPADSPKMEAQGVDPHLLTGALHLVAARLASPEDPEIARQAWSSAIQAYNDAQRRRPSDPDVFLGLCAAWLDLLELELSSAPGDETARAPRFSQAEVSCQDGLRIDPDSVPLLLGRSRVDLLHARWRLEEGLDPSPWITDSARSAERVLALDPEHPTAAADLEEGEALRRAAREGR